MDAEVKVGRKVEITNEEARRLRELANVMASATKTMKAGWLLEYFTAHRASHRIIRVIVNRSHEPLPQSPSGRYCMGCGAKHCTDPTHEPFWL